MAAPPVSSNAATVASSARPNVTIMIPFPPWVSFRAEDDNKHCRQSQARGARQTRRSACGIE
jgi:hypothetical protein